MLMILLLLPLLPSSSLLIIVTRSALTCLPSLCKYILKYYFFFFFCFFHLQEQRYKLRLQQQDVDVYEESVATNSGTRKGGRWERLTFKIILSYHGASFDGWQKQPDLNTVQGYM